MESLTGVLFCAVVAIAGSGDGVELTARCSKVEGVVQESDKMVQVRLAGIDVPQAAQPYGADAWSMMNELLIKRPVRFVCPDLGKVPEGAAGQEQFSKPLSCTAWAVPASAPNGRETLDIGMAMLTVGLAVYNEDTAGILSPQQRGQYSFAQEEARAKKVGVWKKE